MKKWIILLAGLMPALALAHSGSGSPYVLINGAYAPANIVYSLYLDTAQDVSPDTYIAGRPVKFAVDTTVLTSNAFRWRWPDKTVTDGKETTYTFKAPGSYLVGLQSQLDPGANFADIDTIQVNVAPNAAYRPPTGKVAVTQVRQDGNSHTLSFEAFAATDASTGVASYEWKFGDGTTSTQQKTEHTFPGTEWQYYPKLRVTDQNGLYGDVSFELTATTDGVRATNLTGGPDILTAPSPSSKKSIPWVPISAAGAVALLGLLVIQAKRRR